MWFLPLLAESRVSQYTCHQQNPLQHYGVTIQYTIHFWSYNLSWILGFLVWCWQHTHTHTHTHTQRSFTLSLFPSLPLISDHSEVAILSHSHHSGILSPLTQNQQNQGLWTNIFVTKLVITSSSLSCSIRPLSTVMETKQQQCYGLMSFNFLVLLKNKTDKCINMLSRNYTWILNLELYLFHCCS